MVFFLVFSAPVAGILSAVALPIFRGMMSRIVGADEQGITPYTLVSASFSAFSIQ